MFLLDGTFVTDRSVVQNRTLAPQKVDFRCVVAYPYWEVLGVIRNLLVS